MSITVKVSLEKNEQGNNDEGCTWLNNGGSVDLGSARLPTLTPCWGNDNLFRGKLYSTLQFAWTRQGSTRSIKLS